ncbi:MAG: LLM class flavin-dependent oxidoreductase [Actinobacteria bacterium]|nr:LLM class flavin-dependent oxidoreductase [Actinomycetota bacterium]
MRYGFVLPGGSAPEQLDQAVRAEAAGWDGVFVWEAGYGVDAWALLAAMAVRTSRVRLGTLLTPLPWRRPWKLASQVATLDHLSAGRAVLSVGLGAVDDVLGDFGEVIDRRVRAEMLDEGIDVVTGLWEGRPVFDGPHYRIDLSKRDVGMGWPRPVQQPRVPIWVVGAWPRPKSMRRVLGCDGVVPVCMGTAGIRPTTEADIRAMIGWLDDHGGRRPGFDVVMEGETPAAGADEAVDTVARWEAAGCTWWLESRWQVEGGDDERRRVVLERLEAGPPRPAPEPRPPAYRPG